MCVCVCVIKRELELVGTKRYKMYTNYIYNVNTCQQSLVKEADSQLNLVGVGGACETSEEVPSGGEVEV